MAEEIFHHGGGGGAAKVSISGANTDGTLTLISTGTMYMAGGNNITISQDGNSLTFVGMDNAGATTFRGGVSTGGNTLGTTGTVNNQIVFVGGNNVTLSQSANANSATITVSGPNTHAVQTGISGISASDTLYTSGTVLFTGSNMITVKSSGAGQTVIIDATQSVQPEGTVQFGVSDGGNTLGTTGMASGTGPRLVFVGGNNITLSQSLDAANSSGTITISGPNIGGAQTGISSIAADGTTYTSGQVVFVGSNAASVNSSAAGQTLIIDVPVQTVQPEGTVQFGVSSGGNTVGSTGMAAGTGPRLVFVGGNNITLSQSLDAGSVSGTITISAGASGAGGIAASLSGNSTSGGAGYSLVSSGTLYLAGGNNVTLSQDGASVTISGANVGGAQTGISGIAGSAASTVTVGTVQFGNANNISFGLNGSTMTASYSQSLQPAQTGISGIAGSAASTVTAGTVQFGNANNVSFGLNGSTMTASFSTAAQTAESNSFGMSNLGNTAGTSGIVSGNQIRYYFAGGNNVTLSQSINGASGTLTISAGSGAGINASISGNTSGTKTVISSGTMYLAGGNNITLSQEGQSITISGAEGGGAGISTYGNTAGTTGIAGENLILVGGSNITLSQSIDAGASSATITIIGASGGGAGFSGGMSTEGNTAGTAGTVDRQVIFVGGSNITLSQSVNASSATVTIIGASGGGAGFTAGASDIGNTSGSTGPVTGRLVMAGMNNITLSQSVVGGNATLSISGPTGGGAGMGNSAAGTAGTSGSVGRELYFYPGNNVTLSQSVNAGSASLTVVAAGATGGQSTQTYNVLSASGNTDGTLTSFTTGTVVLAGGNNITLSQSSNTITIIGASGGGSGFTAGVSSEGNTAGTTGLVPAQIVFVGGSNITLSQSIDASSATITISGPTVFAFTGGVSSGGNTSGDTGSVNNGLVFAGGNNITLSQVTGVSGATITISGPNVGGAQTGISSIVAANATYTSGQVVFVGSNNITVTSGANQSVIISGPTGGGAGMTTLGNTAGTAGTVGRELLIVGGNNISLSQSINGGSATLTIDGATAGTGAGFTAGVSSDGNTAGTTGLVPGQIVFVGGNNVTLSQSINASSATITISGPNVGGAQTGISGIVDGGGNSITAGTVVFANSNAVSFGFNSNTMTASFSQTVQPEGVNTIGMSDLGNTAGTSGVVNGSNLQYYFAGGNNVTLSQSINGSSATLTISGVNTVAQSNQNIVFYATSNTISSSVGTINASSIILKGNDRLSVGISNGSLIFEAGGADAFTGSQVIGMSNLSNTSGTSGVVSGSAIRYYLAGGNNVTLSQSLNGVSGTVTISAAAQTVQTQGMVSINGSTGAMTFNAGNNMSLSTNGSSLTFINVLSSSGIAQPVSNVSSAGTQSSRYALADHAHVGVAGINASGTASTFVGNVMISVSNLTLVTGGNSSAGTIGISAAAPGGAGPAVGITNTGNTAGDLFTASNGSVYVQGSNNITASASTAAGASTIWISGPSGGGAGMGTGTNTSGTSGTVGKQLYIYGNSNIGLSQSVDGSSASLTLIGQAGGGGATVSEWMPPGIGYSSFTQMGQSSLVMFPVAPPYYVTATQANLWASISLSTSSNSSHNGRISLHVGIYTKNASTLSLASSGSVSHSWNVTGSTSSGSVAGWRALTVPIDVNMTPGQYWVGVISATATTNANWFTASNMGLVAVPAAFSGPLGATNNTNQFMLGAGVWSAQSAALPASVAFSHITATSASTARPVVNFVNLTV